MPPVQPNPRGIPSIAGAMTSMVQGGFGQTQPNPMKLVFRSIACHAVARKWLTSRVLTLLVAVGLIFSSFSAQAIIVGPYALDANTLHLWHLNETTVPAIDAVAAGTNLTVLGTGAALNLSSFAGFGTALSTTGNIAAYLAPRALANSTADDTAMTYADTTTGAFTIEGIVRVDWDPATFSRGNVPLYLITGENETGNRPWQF